MVVSKAVKMAQKMNIPILGLVENFSYFHCPDNGKDYEIFGKSHIEQVALENRLPVLAKLPINPSLANACDAGAIEDADFESALFEGVLDTLKRMI